MRLDPSVDSWHGHERDGHPWWNESSWFGFCVPERNINGWFYYWHRPNMNLTAGGIAVWDDTGAESHDCLYQHWFPFNPFPTEGDQFDFDLSNGMRVRSPEPLKRYELGFRNDEAELDLVWHGTVEAQTDDLEMATSSDIGSWHYDQLGRVEGTIAIGGEEIAVDCHHIRDRSWGVRKPFPPGLRGGLDMGWAEDDTAWVATMLATDAPEDESATIETLAYGQLVKDGVASLATAGTRVTHRDANGVAERIVVDVQDADGRAVHAEGAPRNVYHYDELWALDWMLMRWDTINGSPGWGETQDMVPRDRLRRNHRRAL